MATRNTGHKTALFREQLGDAPVTLDDYKVDELRKLASEFHITGSHGLKKPELVAAINKAKTSGDASY